VISWEEVSSMGHTAKTQTHLCCWLMNSNSHSQQGSRAEAAAQLKERRLITLEELAWGRTKESSRRDKKERVYVFTNILPSWVSQLVSHPSIRPFSSTKSGVGLRRQPTQQADPDFPLTRNTFQLTLGDPEAFPGQPGDIMPPACPGSSPRSIFIISKEK